MHIALVFPKSTFLTNPLVWPPLGLFYLSAQLEAQGHTTDFYDMSLCEQLPQDGAYDQLWISSTAPQIHEVRKIAEITENWSFTKTVLGGSGVWANPANYLDLPFDLLVAGEGDHPFVVDRILHTDDQKLLTVPTAPNLDWVLPPNRRWTRDYHSYMTDRSGREHRMSSLFTTRGCPMSCAFCESGRLGVIWNDRVRYEPMDVVEQQILESAELGFTGLGYYDDIFIINKARTYEMLDLHRDYGMVFRAFMRSDLIHKHGGKDYLRELRDGGLIEMFLGIESADNHIKQNIHKGTTIEQDTEVLQWARDLGIRCKVSFILGLPGESYESMERTAAWIFQHRPDIVQVDRLIPFTGTPLTDNPEKFDLVYDEMPEDEWFFRGRYDIDSKSFVSTSNLTREQIDAFWHTLEQELLAEGLSGYNH